MSNNAMIHADIRATIGEERYKKLYGAAILWGNKKSEEEYPIIRDPETLDKANEAFSAWAFNRLTMDLTTEMRKHETGWLNKNIQNPFRLRAGNTRRLFLVPIQEPCRYTAKGYKIKLIKWTPDWNNHTI